METEERFGIKIPDEEASQVRTVGEFLGCVLAHLPHGPAVRCHTAAAFYRLRRALVDTLCIGRREVRPQTRLADLLPAVKVRRQTWKGLQNRLALRLTDLERPGWLKKVINLGAIASSLYVLALNLGTDGRRVSVSCVMAAILAGLISLIPYYGLAYLLTRSLARCLPEKCATVGQAAKAILAGNYGSFANKTSGADWREVWAVLRTVISEQLGVKESELTFDQRFVEDLNCD
jgi:acyl carrier protein